MHCRPHSTSEHVDLLGEFLLSFQICARSSGPEAAVKILAKIKLTSPFGVAANVPDRWITPYVLYHLLFYAIFRLILVEPSQADVCWMLVFPSIKPQNCCYGQDNQTRALKHNSFTFVKFHVSERPQCTRSKLPLPAIRDTADQSMRGMKHKRPRIAQSPAHVRHMVAFGLDGFSPESPYAQLSGNTTVVSAALPKTRFISADSIWSCASSSPCDIISRHRPRRGIVKADKAAGGRIQEQRGGRRRAKRATVTARTRTHGTPSGTLINKHWQSHIHTLRRQPCAKCLVTRW